jgi:small subunit ribosomal protein S5
MLSKSLGSTNKVNIAYAVIEALQTLVPKDQWLNADKSAKKAPKADAEASEVEPAEKKAPATKKAAEETK